MTTTPERAKPNIEWLAQQLRITIFHSAIDLGDKIHGYWTEAFGSTPQQDETKNLEGVRVVGGQIGDTQWTMNIRAERTDILAQPVNIPPPGSTDVWNKFERGYQQAMRELSPASQLLINMTPSINRLAVGALLLAPAPSLSEAYAKLSLTLPRFQFEGLDAPDFSFQVNRRRRSQVSSGIWINRLATWSIAQGQTVSFGRVGDGSPVASGSRIQFAASLQLDINTAHVDASRSIPADKAKDVLSELMEMALEIAHEGDVA